MKHPSTIRRPTYDSCDPYFDGLGKDLSTGCGDLGKFSTLKREHYRRIFSAETETLWQELAAETETLWQELAAETGIHTSSKTSS